MQIHEKNLGTTYKYKTNEIPIVATHVHKNAWFIFVLLSLNMVQLPALDETKLFN